jgi:hypothetical protein
MPKRPNFYRDFYRAAWDGLRGRTTGRDLRQEPQGSPASTQAADQRRRLPTARRGAPGFRPVREIPGPRRPARRHAEVPA